MGVEQTKGGLARVAYAQGRLTFDMTYLTWAASTDGKGHGALAQKTVTHAWMAVTPDFKKVTDFGLRGQDIVVNKNLELPPPGDLILESCKNPTITATP
jgi:hypothetical protein